MAAQTDVCIVGGGVGGLACALALRRAGVACQVFERDASFGDRRNGYGMTLSADDKGPLGQLGVLDACRALSCVSKSHFIFDGTGRVRGYYGRALRGDAPANDSPEKKRHTGRTGSLRVQRQQLRRVLLDALEALDVKVRWNSPLESYEESDAGVVATFAGGVQCECNALVGADGIRSLVRLQRDAALQSSGEATQDLRWLGVGVVVGISAHRHSLVEDRGFYMLTGSARLFTMPFAADMTMWQFSFKIEGDADDAAALLSNHGTGAKARLLAHALTLVPHRGADADGALGRVVEAVISATEDVWATPLYDRSAMPLPKRAKASRVTVLGDACHPMTCFKGQGANQALADAVLFAKCYTKRAAGVSTRLRTFEREMVQRAAPRAAASFDAARHYHSEEALVVPSDAFSGFLGDTGALAEHLDAAGLQVRPEQSADALEAALAEHTAAFRLAADAAPASPATAPSEAKRRKEDV